MKRKRPIEVLTDEEAYRLFYFIPRESPSAKRNRALLALLYGAGLRLREATAVLLRDIRPTDGKITVRRGKGHKQRTVGLPDDVIAHMKPWLKVRSTLDIGGSGVFCPGLWGASQGSELSPRYVRRVVRRYGDRAGITKRLHPHSLRHSHACRLADKGVPLNVIQKQLGHASIATTSLYLDALSANHVVDRVRESWS